VIRFEVTNKNVEVLPLLLLLSASGVCALSQPQCALSLYALSLYALSLRSLCALCSISVSFVEQLRKQREVRERDERLKEEKG
jgi:hypothetical protein